MQREDREIVRRTVAGYLEEHAPERQGDFELVFAPVYEVMTGAAAGVDSGGVDSGGAADGEQGLPIDGSFLDGAVVSSAIWAAASLLRMWRAEGGGAAVREAEARVARELADPELVRCIAAGLRRELAKTTPRPPISPSEPPESPPRFGEQPPAAPPDARAELVVLWRPRHDGLAFRLTAPALGLDQQPHEQPRLDLGLYEACRALIREVETADGEADVADRGEMLFRELLPAPLQEQLRELAERGVRTLRVVSDEPWIPWEAVRIAGREGRFLADAFDLVRWLPGPRAPGELPWRRVAVVAPRQAGLPRLEDEVARVRAFAGVDRTVERLEARKEVVREALTGGGYDGWHFCGHGARARDRNAANSRLELAEGRYLQPVNLYGGADGLGGARPLVVLNACHAGRGGLSLTGIGGWAAAFLRAGAGAFLGPLWSIRDSGARRFAVGFYDRFLAGETVAAAVRGARGDVGDAVSRLAYTLYADPDARCTTPGSAAP